MKKTILVLIIAVLFIRCNDKNANDCIQTQGAVIKEEVVVASFNKILVNDKIELFIIEAAEQKVVVEGGKNLLNDISFLVTDSRLEITNNNSCFVYKDFNVKVYIYSPNISEIRNSSVFPVRSVGVLNYPDLNLISEDYLSDFLNSGDFNLTVNSKKIRLVANGPSNHTIKGFTKNLNVVLAGNTPLFNGEELTAENANLFARSTSDISINVTNEVKGNLYSTGDVILFTKPNSMKLTAHYTGRIILNY